MRKLFELCQSQPKIWKEFESGSHNDTIAEEGYFESIDEFVDQFVLQTKAPTKDEAIPEIW